MDEQGAGDEFLGQRAETIREQKRRIERLARSTSSPDEFFVEFLERVVASVDGIGGAVWMVCPGDEIRLEYQVRLAGTHLLASDQNFQRHGDLLRHTIGKNQPLVASWNGATSAPSTGAADPAQAVLLLAPLALHGTVAGVTEIFVPANTSPATIQANLQFLTRICDYAVEFLQARYFKDALARQQTSAQLEQFTRKIHASLDLTLTAYAVANEGLGLVGCDRVSVAKVQGGRWTLVAVSGQDQVERRSNQVRGLERLARTVGQTGEALWYTEDTTGLAPQVIAAVQAYVDVSRTRSLAVIPLVRPSDPAASAGLEPAQEKSRARPPMIGVLIAELINEAQPPAGWRERVRVVCEHAELALGRALEHENLFLMPLWRAIGRARWLVQAQTLPKTLTVAALVLAVILGLALIPADFELEGRGALEPDARREVFARVDGVVREVRVKHGQTVREGDILAVLRNHELEISQTSLAGKRRETLASLHSMRTALLVSEMPEAERNRVGGEVRALEGTLAGITAQEQLVALQIKDLQVVSPLAGQITTWDVANLLTERPVQRGHKLLSVADPTGPWMLEIRMPENRIGHIVHAQQQATAELPVSFVLATDPGVQRQGTIQEIAERAEADPERGNTVLIKVRFHRDDVPAELLKPGALAVARVHCGRRSIGYVWLHDVWEWVQREVLFRF